MEIRRFKIPMIIAGIHLILGNIIGMNETNSMFIEILGLPYTFIAGVSQWVGWDYFSILFEILSYILITLLFFLVSVLIKKIKFNCKITN